MKNRTEQHALVFDKFKGGHYWMLQDRKGRVVARSAAYTRRSGAARGFARMVEAVSDGRYDIKVEVDLKR